MNFARQTAYSWPNIAQPAAEVETHEHCRSRSNRVELDRTRTPQKMGKRPPKAHELRGMIEVGRTRSNFDIKFHRDSISAECKKRFLNSELKIQGFNFVSWTGRRSTDFESILQPLRLALPKISRGWMKLANLANFDPEKMPIKKELGQRFFEDCDVCFV